MPGLVPGIHVLRAALEIVDARDKPGHDSLLSEPKLNQQLNQEGQPPWDNTSN